MALEPKLRLAIQAQLRLGAKPKDVAEQFDVKLPTVYKISQDLKNEEESEIVQELNEIPTEIIAHVIEESKKVLPMPTPSGKTSRVPEAAGMAGAMEALAVGAEGLKLLDNKFQSTIGLVLSRFDKIAKDGSTTLKDLKLIIDTASNAHEKIFSSGTNIHIGDKNSHSSQQLTVFQSKKGV